METYQDYIMPSREDAAAVWNSATDIERRLALAGVRSALDAGVLGRPPCLTAAVEEIPTEVLLDQYLFEAAAMIRQRRSYGGLS